MGQKITIGWIGPNVSLKLVQLNQDFWANVPKQDCPYVPMAVCMSRVWSTTPRMWV